MYNELIIKNWFMQLWKLRSPKILVSKLESQCFVPVPVQSLPQKCLANMLHNFKCIYWYFWCYCKWNFKKFISQWLLIYNHIIYFFTINLYSSTELNSLISYTSHFLDSFGFLASNDVIYKQGNFEFFTSILPFSLLSSPLFFLPPPPPPPSLPLSFLFLSSPPPSPHFIAISGISSTIVK